jgi:hypothetical protein
MKETKPAETAFRVAIFAGALGLVGWLPPDLQWMAAFLCIVGTGLFIYEIWLTRRVKRAWIGNLIWAGLAFGAAVALVNGMLSSLATPLFALAGVCLALGLIASFSENGEGESAE